MDVVIADVKGIRRDLTKFLKEFSDCMRRECNRVHLRTYVEGQIGGLERKSVEPMALAAGVAPRTLQEFLGMYLWDHEGVRGRVQDLVIRDHASDHAIAVIDETSFVKQGDKTAGVQRQYCGASGKKDNCVVTVHLGYVAGNFHALIDSDLFLPEKSWDSDRDRCRAAGIPDEVRHRPKWQIALELLDRAIDHGVRFEWLTADEGYGHVGAFRKGVDSRGLWYMVEVNCSQTGWTHRPRVVDPATWQGCGRPPKHPQLAKNAPAPRRVDALWTRGGPSWHLFHIKNSGNGPVVWEARATRFFPWENKLPGQECWLIIARNVLDGEVKYFLSNAPADMPVEVLLHVAFNRWHIERVFEDAKGEIGLDHFEVRNYLSIQRHLILSMVSFLFLMRETEQLQKKRCMDHLPSTCGRQRAA